MQFIYLFDDNDEDMCFSRMGGVRFLRMPFWFEGKRGFAVCAGGGGALCFVQRSRMLFLGLPAERADPCLLETA